MKSSNTYPEAASRWFRTLGRIAAGLAALCLPGTVQAVDAGRGMPEFIRDRWGAEQGFPGGAVNAITETPDGYLWIGAEKGLVRFDGTNFRLFNRANPSTLPASPVLGLTTDAEGSLWIRLQSANLLRYRAGKLETPLPDLIPAESGVTAMCRGKNGDVLLARANGMLRYSEGKMQTVFSTNAPNPLVISMAETNDGRIWMGTRDVGLFRLDNGQATVVAGLVPDKKVNSVLPAGEADLWVGTDGGLVRWTRSGFTSDGVPESLRHARIVTMLRDREGNTWVATSQGLWKVGARGAAPADERTNSSRGAVNALFEDRDGNLWVGSSHGLERWRESVFLTHSMAEDSPSEYGGPLYADGEERIWFAPSMGGLGRLKGTQMESVRLPGLSTDVVYSIAGGGHEVWIGRQRGGLTCLHLTAGTPRFESFTQDRGLARNTVYAVHRSRDGTVWAGTLGGGVSRLRNGVFTTYDTSNGLASDTVTSIAETADGTMWFATPNGLSSFAREQWRAYTGADGLPPGNVDCLFADAGGMLWIGTGKGLLHFASGRVETPRRIPEQLLDETLGITEDRYGWLWVATANQVLRVNRNRLLGGALSDGDVRRFGPADGLRGTIGLKRHRSLITDPQGRVWLSLNRGIAVADPARLSRRTTPTPVQIESISADGAAVSLSGPIEIPPAPRRLTFKYAGVNLSNPELVRFRYTLDGNDAGWSEPAPLLEASYTNLSPGSYRFRVMARNPDGDWNGEEAVIGFRVKPAYWQTWWFRLCVVLACLLAITGVYRRRLHRVTRQMNRRFEERLVERTRIAQELHDTLLQGFLSASMQLHVAAETLPADSPAKAELTRVLQLMRQVTEEGRNAVRGLRSRQPDTPSLEEALSKVREEEPVRNGTAFRMIVEGQPRPLHPVLRDEVYRIAREALVNAFRHSGATSIEAELEYTKNELRVLVRDNGCGIDDRVLRSGNAEGHWGLPGMRERAERIGAHLSVWSRAAAGTEVVLSVPGHRAFGSLSPDQAPRWSERLFRRKPTIERAKAGSKRD